MKFKKLLSFAAAAAMAITALTTSLSASVIGASAADEILPDSGSWQGTTNDGTSQLMLINNTTKTISALSGATEFYITFDVTGVDENTAAYVIFNISSGTSNWSPSESCPLTATPADGKYTVKYSGVAIKDTPGFSFLGVAFVDTANNNSSKKITKVTLDSVTLTDPNEGSGSDSDISGTLTITANNYDKTNSSYNGTTDVEINGAGSYSATVNFSSTSMPYISEMGYFTYNGNGAGNFVIDVDSITINDTTTFTDVVASTDLIPTADYGTSDSSRLPCEGQYAVGTKVAGVNDDNTYIAAVDDPYCYFRLYKNGSQSTDGIVSITYNFTVRDLSAPTIGGTLTITANNGSSITSDTTRASTDVEINGAGSYSATIQFTSGGNNIAELGFFTYNGTGSLTVDVDSITFSLSDNSIEPITFTGIPHSTGLIPAAEYSADTSGENPAALPRMYQYGKRELIVSNEDGYNITTYMLASARPMLYDPTGAGVAVDTITYNFTVENLSGGYITELLDELKTAIAEAEAIDTTKYTDDSVAVLTSALETAKALTSDSSAGDIIAAKNSIETAVSGLVSKLVGVTEAINNAKTYNENTYTTSTYKVLTDAIAAAEAVVAKGDDATLDEMQSAIDSINNAIEGLRVRADQEHLSRLSVDLNGYRNLSESNYTEESWAPYKEVLDRALYYNSNKADATNEDIDQVFIDLEAAKQNLVKKTVFDYTDLETAVEEGKTIKDDPTSADKYMPDGYQKFLTAFEEGEALLEAKNATTQTMIYNAASSITSAIKNLVEVNKAELFNALQDTIANADAREANKYTEDSYAPLAAALETAKALTAESSLASIVSAQEVLDAALEGLVLNQVEIPAGGPLAYIRYGWTDKPFYSGVISEDMAGATQIKLTFDCADDTSFNSFYTIPVAADIGGTVSNTEMRGSTTEENLGEKGCSYVIDLTAAAEAGQSYTLTGYTYGYGSAADYILAITKIEFIDEDGYILDTITDKTIAQAELAKAIAEAEAVETSIYTDESVEALTSALEVAKAITDEAELEEIQEATQVLKEALEGLISRFDYTALDAAIAEGDAVVGTLYTKESYEVLAQALGVAKTIRTYLGATQEDIDNAAKALNEAIAGLELLIVTGNVTGTINVSDEDDTTEMTVVAAAADGTEVSVTAKSMGTYVLEGLEAGDYTLTISGGKYAPRTYEITVEAGDIAQDVNLNPLGDINGDGKVTTADVGLANSHAKGVTTLTDYDFVCGDVNADGSITTADVGMINSHAKGVKALW